MRELMLGNELKLSRRQFSDAGVGHFYQGLNSMSGVMLGGYTTPVYGSPTGFVQAMPGLARTSFICGAPSSARLTLN
jgi:hypothetical protein